ncbi:MAG: bifunctional diaminohydroxyphosphoribosylaminopyrimidine deaminase/5-amino-6-(5-phosphoribosylamino)uracil reductase RibD [Sphingomonas sp.]|nr:bifunctional diaminohydroxyphosphoribosylaminopyrimidine deaminase/5-amino-6-(5-phosphoribosylamino)uracil reductase RibD [Sphingomonas sp.]
MGAALALGQRTRGRTAPNPNVGCMIVAEGRVVGRGWTQPGGRPHAEAMALAEAGDAARGGTAYVTLEPCAHVSPRGPACADLLIAGGVARVVAALGDPDARTNGAGFDRLRAAGIAVTTGVRAADARDAMAGFLTRRALGRPLVTLKLALSLDGMIARADGESQWITGAEARAHTHLERGRHEAILVGRGTYEADAPRLDVRLPGLESRSPRRLVLTTRPLDPDRDAGESEGLAEPARAVAERPRPSPGRRLEIEEQARHPGESRGLPDHRLPPWETLPAPAAIADLEGVDHLLVEGGAGAASAFLAADLVDRLLLYRAPILIGGGRPALGDIGLDSLAQAHGRWRLADRRRLGHDELDVFHRTR